MSDQPRGVSSPNRSRKVEVIVTLIIAALIYLPVRGCLDKHSEEGGRGRRWYGRLHDLRTIGMAIEVYVLENGAMPVRLWDLNERYIDNPRVLASPGDVAGDGAAGDWTPERYHYLYEGGADPKDVPEWAPLVVYPYDCGEGMRFSVLFKGGNAESFDEGDFLNVLAGSAREGSR